jgi:hypothetical protein
MSAVDVEVHERGTHVRLEKRLAGTGVPAERV